MRAKTSSGAAPAQLVVRVEHVVAKPVHARARRLLLVGDVVLARQRRRQRRDAAEQVGLLERDVARDPRRRADVQVTFEVRYRARPDRRRLHIGCAADHGSAGRQPELGRGLALELTDHGGCRDEVGQLGPVDAGQREQRRLVVDRVEITVVGEPVQHDRVVRRRGDAGEIEVHPVLGLEVLPRRARDVRFMFLQPQDVRDGILARARRRAARELDPPAQLARVVALHAHRATDALADDAGAARVHPDHRVPQRGAIARRPGLCPTTAP